MNISLKNKTAVIWDFDGVFYDYDVIPDKGFYRLCDKATAMAVCGLITNLDEQVAADIARKSFEKHHDIITEFIPLAVESGISEDEFKAKLFYVYHKSLFELTNNNYPNLLSVSASTVTAFANLNGLMKHTILSASDAETWIYPTLSKMKLSAFFPQESVIGFSAFDFKSKSQSAHGVTTALGRLGVSASDAIFVEDNTKNLQVAKEAHPELTTILISSKDEKPNGVDIVLPSQVGVLNILAAHKLGQVNVPKARQVQKHQRQSL